MGEMILFGAGYYGRVALELIDNDKIDFIVDNNPDKEGTVLSGRPIRCYKNCVKELHGKYIVICLAEEKCKDVAEQLNKDGITKYVTIHDYRNKLIQERITDSRNNIKIYQNAIKWIDEHTVDGEGIINFTGANEAKAYPEVTGYFILSLLRWGYRDKAVQYARWLCTIQDEKGFWSDVYGGVPYIFDTAQILKGLISIRGILPEVDECIIKGCDWMLTRMLPDGRLCQEDTAAWDFDMNPDIELIHIYCLSPLIDAAGIFERTDYSQAAEKILNYYNGTNAEGILNYRMLSHFYAYVIEGLIDIGKEAMAKKAMDKIAFIQKEDGSVIGMPNVEWVCSTGLFQFAICWYKLGNIENGNKAFDFACRLQNASGGWYGSYRVSDSNENLPYMPNQEISWAVKFFLDALYYKNRAEFNLKSDTFLDNIGFDDERYMLVLDEIRRTSAHRVLDVGCGKGRYLKNLLKDYFCEYYAADISKIVMEKLPPEVKRKEGTLTDIPYETDSFDFTYTCEALEHAVDIESAIREMARVTRTGGKICVIDKNVAKLGVCSIEEWEQWFDVEELKQLIEKYCENVYVVENLASEAKANELFYAWLGTVK